MIFKARELKKFNKFIQEIVEVYPMYNRTKYFNKLLEIYKKSRY